MPLRRRLILALCLLASPAPAVAATAPSTQSAAAASTPAPAPAGRISATVETCHQASGLAGRYATFAAQMTAVPGTAEMSIRFELDQRTPAAPGFHPLTGVPGFGIWTSSAPGVGIFGYSQEVSSLTAPAAFRVTVMYRWLGPRHRVIRRARRVTPACVVAVPPAPAAGAGPGAPAGTVVGSPCPAGSGPAGAGKPVACP